MKIFKIRYLRNLGIRADLAPDPPAPTPLEPEKPKGFLTNFINFHENKGIIGLAVAVIIGGAAGKYARAYLLLYPKS